MYMKRKTKLATILLPLLFHIAGYGQQSKVSGIVSDINTGQPLRGVTVQTKGKQAVTLTNDKGQFSISATPDQYLVFTCVGYKTKELPVTPSDSISIMLEPENQTLGEVVVVGYGTQKRANLTGAVGSVKADAFKDRPITNASQALSGQVSGVWVNQTSGQPGADAAAIRIRGIGTLGNSNPLVLVDGIVSSLSAVNPNDIASFTVLKDAASAAIYGSRAANGVILIETKQGKKGPLHVELHSYFGRQKATVLPGTVTNSVELMQLYNTALANEGNAPFYSQAIIDEYKNGKDPLVYPNNDWINIVIRPASLQEHIVTLSGGKEATQYSTSFGYLDQNGIVMNDKWKRYSMHFNLRSEVSDRFDWGVRTNLISNKRNKSYYIEGTGVSRELMRALPFFGTYTADGKYASTWVNTVNTQFNNPLAILNEGLNQDKGNSAVGNVYFNFEILKGLKWNATGGVNYNDNFYERFIPELFAYDPKTGAVKNKIGNAPRSLTNTYSRSLLTTFYTTLTYTHTFHKDHDVTILGGFNQEKYTDKSLNAYIEGFLSNSLTELNAGSANKDVSGTGTDYGIRSVFGRLNYAFQNRYLFEANLRYDGSSRFAEDNRWGIFPSFSAGWRITEEAFMKGQKVFSNLKLRGSWGKLGNDQIGLYRYIPTLSLGRDYYFNGVVSSGVAQTAVPNEAITWETAEKTDIGLEAGFLKNRLSIEFDYFNENRKGILRNINLPWTVGALAAPAVNLADVNNKGWEFNTNYTHEFKDLRVSGGFNITHVKNEVTKIPDPQIGFNILKEGEPVNAFYMWKAVGIYQSQEEVDASAKPVGRTTKPGDIKFEDISGPDGKPDGKITADDRQVVGKPIPTWTYGINLSAAYKGFDLGVLAQGVADVESYVLTEEFIPFFNGAGITTRWLSGNTWTPDNPNAPLPRLLRNNASAWNYESNSFWLQNASYLRIKNIQLGYTLPGNFTGKAGIQSLRVYVNAQNAFTFTKFQGLDPERSLTATSPSQYPNIRIITCGVNIKF